MWKNLRNVSAIFQAYDIFFIGEMSCENFRLRDVVIADVEIV